ncbi:ferric-dicitrate binding protein FerR, regulates iron transport through sigma-19 [Pseudarcicella hirudinis]|uniref:Ferric-dicitrate binding protein FerR, regulates iron transport through sigma-19 n=1 Tax=Pseudarcicella hirudinis TaxID=1079859 RepID=A0A1I5TU50_9BACT|nr:FecR family protein [Pseudarcicella hirudinis]SFP86600.1 ferric-dicitrate binding protein FerR, regulates iron transport through sigma-19 [Pseudarcicella hirudinis]
MKENQDYHHLLENPNFRAWVLGERPQDENDWINWIKEDISGTRKEEVEKAKTIIRELHGKPAGLDEQYIEEQVQKALFEAKRLELNSAEEEPVLPLLWSRYWMAAASVLLLLGMSWYGLLKNNIKPEEELYHRQVTEAGELNDLVEITNDGNTDKLIRLPDGSSVALHQQSKLSYQRKFDGSKREVYLIGEAFFEVAKNPERPFFVYSNELITKVLGTSFRIKSFGKDKEIRVIVKTGKVAVFTMNDEKAKSLKNNRELTGMLLTPNQQAIFQRDEVRLVRTIIPNPEILMLPVENQKFEFNATPVSEVLETLERAYGVDIVFDEEVMAKCTITAKLGNEPLFEKLNWICSIIEASYQVSDGQIIISGKPC